MRYYTCGHDGYFSHHVLLDDRTLQSIARKTNASELFCSVQSYDMSGTELSSQLVFDIDNKSMLDAYQIARDIQDEIEWRYDVDTTIWFSGSKGFHVITGLVAKHHRANEAMKYLALRISTQIDPAMYKSRSLFRLPNTLNGKSGLYKIQVNHNESLKSVLERAKTKQIGHSTDLVIDNKKFLSDFDQGLQLVLNRTEQSIVIEDQPWIESLPPCMTKLMNNTPSGSRWDYCYWIVRHWRLCGIDVEKAVSLSQMYPVFTEGNYTKGMIRHYYYNEPRSVGCLSGPLSSVMQDNCYDSCKHSEGWGDRITGRLVDGLTTDTR